MSGPRVALHRGDCREVMLRDMEPGSVNLIVTSPPYGQMRAAQYGGIKPEAYPAWWMEVMAAVDRVLAPGGSVCINWQAGRAGGGKQTWDIKALLAMLDGGWRMIDEYCWHNSCPMPGRWKFMLANGWERIHHMVRDGEDPHAWNPDAVAAKRVWQSPRSKARFPHPSGHGVDRKAMSDRNHLPARPSNVLHTHSQSDGQARSTGGHPAAFPEALPRFFVRLLSNPGDLVCDPFAGSGTTLHVAIEEGRRAVGVELKPEYSAFLEKRFAKIQTTLLSEV